MATVQTPNETQHTEDAGNTRKRKLWLGALALLVVLAVVGVLLGAAAGWDHQHAIQVALWLAVIASTGSVVFSLSRLRTARSTGKRCTM